MKFSLRSLSLVMAVVPPIVWWCVLALRPRDLNHPVAWPDPVLIVAPLAWLGMYYSLVYKRLPK